MLGWVRAGLRDFSISRSSAAMSWGIPLPQDATHNTYVWCWTRQLSLLSAACVYCNNCVPLTVQAGHDGCRCWRGNDTTACDQ